MNRLRFLLIRDEFNNFKEFQKVIVFLSDKKEGFYWLAAQ